MKPILFDVWGFKVYGYGFMIAIGIIFAIILLTKRSNKAGYNEDHILNMTIISIIAGILGGKILYIITDFKSIIKNPEILRDFGAGFVIYGAIIAGVLSVYLYAKRKSWDILEVFDLVIPSLPLAQGFGRIGCLLAGCCYGAETNSVCSIVFTGSQFAPNNVHLHPTQIYSSIFDFILAAVLIWYDKRNKGKGKTFILYLICYSAGRFFVEFLRNDPRGNVGNLSTSQFISIFVFIIGVYLFKTHSKNNKSV
ncbi:prolipoprotein diacylglyceryl transferase [Clostridium frigidicarnis]|uniref:Phosphatidylglycerol--prolipoprotein diacylglyceryl transferase n=1 Tax=Clostridium frigidicarnis TaxID=84698 RepID=A0A1I0YPD0_9CLOT|nr:prolipoprotein diacylglyceryl transferase [Clostridium frigidicarnis]SFB14787.1 Prolipoprotein diacylglyceryl transferase [Clostridium frigidicarnis]